jgi:hypothetical protein
MVDSFVSPDDDSWKNMLTERHHFRIVTGLALSTSVICCPKVLMAGSVELHFVSVANFTRLALSASATFALPLTFQEYQLLQECLALPYVAFCHVLSLQCP